MTKLMLVTSLRRWQMIMILSTASQACHHRKNHRKNFDGSKSGYFKIVVHKLVYQCCSKVTFTIGSTNTVRLKMPVIICLKIFNPFPVPVTKTLVFICLIFMVDLLKSSTWSLSFSLRWSAKIKLGEQNTICWLVETKASTCFLFWTQCKGQNLSAWINKTLVYYEKPI